MVNKKDSYTSASGMPFKIFKDVELISSLNSGKIMPRHIQVCPTNVCNLSCSWCSCADRKQNDSIEFDRLKQLFKTASKLGTKAVTITGGGEPLLYKQINELFKYIVEECNIKIGLVSNGTVFKKLEAKSFEYITWNRISHGDTYGQTDKLWDSYEYAMQNRANVDFSFSYVVGQNPDYLKIKNIIEFANKHNFTHVRLVPELFSIDSIDLSAIKQTILSMNLDDSLVIYQERNNHTRGAKKCHMSILKPQIAADGYIYPCCGVQYAISDNDKNFPPVMRMGQIEDFEDIVNQQRVFDGSVCNKCYYDNYNMILDKAINALQHIEFI